MISRIFVYFVYFIFIWEARLEAQNRVHLLDPHMSHFSAIEQKYKIPRGLLSAISKVESGRYHEKHKKIISSPWAIHAEGEGRFFNSKKEAIDAVQSLIKKGVKNIDMGIMQINRMHHPHAFSSLDKAFEPKENIEYAAKFLTNLKKEHGSWSEVIAHYHSAIPTHHIPYRNKVYKMWEQERRNSLSSWIEEANNRLAQSEGDNVFRSPQFRIIRVNSIRKMPLRENSSSSTQKKFHMGIEKNYMKNKKSSPLRLTKVIQTPSLHMSNLSIQRFKFIKHRKDTPSSSLTQMTSSLKKPS